MFSKTFHLLNSQLSHNYSIADCPSHSDLDYVLSLITHADQIAITRSARQHVFIVFIFFDLVV